MRLKNSISDVGMQRIAQAQQRRAQDRGKTWDELTSEERGDIEREERELEEAEHTEAHEALTDALDAINRVSAGEITYATQSILDQATELLTRLQWSEKY